eukprot:COSAG01_NODE_5233_length_4395_cov_932.807728_3_plen_90_part_00
MLAEARAELEEAEAAAQAAQAEALREQQCLRNAAEVERQQLLGQLAGQRAGAERREADVDHLKHELGASWRQNLLLGCAFVRLALSRQR